jgi:hypothetical protein
MMSTWPTAISCRSRSSERMLGGLMADPQSQRSLNQKKSYGPRVRT